MRHLVIGRRLVLCLSTALAAAGLLLCASAAAAAGPELTFYTQVPDTAQPGSDLKIVGAVENSGDGPMSGDLTFTQTLPAGIAAVEQRAGQGTCDVQSQTITCSVPVEGLVPGGQRVLVFRNVAEEPDAAGNLVVSQTVSGGGTSEEIVREETIGIGPENPFAIRTFSADIRGADTSGLQAGSSPAAVENGLSVPFHTVPLVRGANVEFMPQHPTEQARTVVAHVPAGLVANPNALPRCTGAQLATERDNVVMPDLHALDCPLDSQIGIARFATTEVNPLYNMVPPPGVPASFAFNYAGVVIMLDARLRAEDNGFDLVVRNVSTTVPFIDSYVTFWGVPTDPSHDTLRGDCLNLSNYSGPWPQGFVCPAEGPRIAFLRLPTSCPGTPLAWGIEADSYQHPGAFLGAETTTPALGGCADIPFEPSFAARPTTEEADSPSGLDVDLHLPQNDEPDGLAQAHLRQTTVALPPGLNLNPSSAEGLEACAPEQIGLLSAIGQSPARFDGNPPSCPDASKLGTVSVSTPAIDHPLPGTVYLATQDRNPFASLLALYIVIEDPQSGIGVKLPARIDPDPATGQLTTVVPESPQLPFEDLAMRLNGGPRGPLRTPIGCGTHTTAVDLIPWSAPQAKAAHLLSAFEVSKGAGGNACVASEAQAPGTPSFSAGTLSPLAGAYTPFALKLSRADGTQQLTRIDAILPKGLLARLAGVSYCPEAALGGAEARSGASELASPSCPASSEIGRVDVSAGAGPTPVDVAGKVYLAGPYKGAPLSVAVITPATAGPFDLGTVLVRSRLQIDPTSAQASALSDPIPHILRGIPLDVRSISLRLDRPEFTLNPTSCDPTELSGLVGTLPGQSIPLSNRFQVGDCGRLPFRPQLSLRLGGDTERGGNPALRATLRMRQGSANIARASVAMPGTVFLDQAHIKTICTRVQFGAEKCPKGSVYGHAKAISPLLDKPLRGPVYLRSSSNPLPDLLIALDGQVEVELAGRIDTAPNGGIRTTFESVPDAAVSKFVLTMKGGRRGLLQNSQDLCAGKRRATVAMDAHSGKLRDFRALLKASCGKPQHRKGARKRR